MLPVRHAGPSRNATESGGKRARYVRGKGRGLLVACARTDSGGCQSPLRAVAQTGDWRATASALKGTEKPWGRGPVPAWSGDELKGRGFRHSKSNHCKVGIVAPRPGDANPFDAREGEPIGEGEVLIRPEPPNLRDSA